LGCGVGAELNDFGKAVRGTGLVVDGGITGQ
jgi:hypothetical protein